jgi:hypothetical protein
MKLAILPELQKSNNKHVNGGLRVVNVLLFAMIVIATLIAILGYRRIHHAQNTVLVAVDDSILSNATMLVPNWIVVPVTVSNECKLLLPNGTKVPATIVRTQAVSGVDVALLRAEAIPPELLLNAATLTEDQTVAVDDSGTLWKGRLSKRPDGLYAISGDRQLPAGLPVTLESDHTAVVGITAATPTGTAVISIEQLRQSFAEMK